MPVLRDLFSKGVSISADPSIRRLLASGTSTTSGVRVGPESAPSAAAVYSATSLIAQTAATMPVGFVKKGDRSRTPVEPERIRALWTQPNPDQVPVAFYETVIMSLLLWGNAYLAIVPNGRGDVIQVWPLDPERVTDIERTDTPSGQATRYRVSDLGRGDDWLTNVPGKLPEMLHIPWITMPGRLKGLSPVATHAELIGMSLSSQKHAASFLGNGVHMTGVIEADGLENQAAARELWDAFNLMHTGPDKSGRVGVLSGAKFKQLTIPPNELQFLEQMQYSDRKIASIYRVPPHMVGDSEGGASKWGTGIEEVTKGFVKFTILPVIRRIEQSVEIHLLAGSDTQMKFRTAGLLRGSESDRSAYYTSLWNLGVLSQDDIRELEDMAPLPDGEGEGYYRPLNFTRLGEPVAAEGGE